MKRFSKTRLLPILVLLCAVCAAFFACNKQTAKLQATITLDAGACGTLDVTSVRADVGSRIADAVADIRPTETGEFPFDGWYIGADKVADRTVPADGVTLTAKYAVPVSLTVHTPVTLDAYGKAETVEWHGLYGEPFSCRAYTPAKPYFVVDLEKSDPTEQILTESITLEVWLRFDETVIASDLFGGDDLLFFPPDAPDTVQLLRRGLEPTVGTYDPTLRTFSFALGNGSKLEGKASDGKFFYYEDLVGKTAYDGFGTADTLAFSAGGVVTYTNAASAVSVGTYDMDFLTGEYIFSSAAVSFHFVLNQQTAADGTVRLVFNRETNPDERGFYRYKDDRGGSLLYLDGMVDASGVGGIVQYAIEDGAAVAVNQAFYQEWADEVDGVNGYPFDDKTYAVITADSDTPLMLFRLTAAEGLSDVDGIVPKGTYVVSDGYDGYFYDGYSELPDLLLDGFGAAVRLDADGEIEKRGKYEIRSLTIPIVSYDEVYDWTDEWLALTFDGEPPVWERINWNPVGMHAPIAKEPGLVEWAHGTEKVYGEPAFDGACLYDYYGDLSFVYVLGEGSDAAGNTVYSQIDTGEVTAVEDDPSLRHFQSTYYEDDNAFWNFRYTADGKIETTVLGAAKLTVALDDKTLTVDEWGALSYDGQTYPFGAWKKETFGYEYFGHYAIETHPESWYLDRYTFGTGADAVTLIVRTDFTLDVETGAIRETAHTAIDPDKVVDLVYRQFVGQDGYYDILYLGDDGSVEIGFLTENEYGELYHDFVMHGSCTYDGGTGLYRVTVADPEQYREILEGLTDIYDAFEFRLEGEAGAKRAVMCVGTAAVYEGADGKIEPDGYGRATYTPKNGAAVVGQVDLLMAYNAEDGANVELYHFAANNGSVEFVYTLTHPAGEGSVAFAIADSDLGLVYTVGADEYGGYSVYYSQYLVIGRMPKDGVPGILQWDAEIGEFEPTGKTVRMTDIRDSLGRASVWTEYKFSAGGEDTYLIITTLTMPDGTDTKVFFEQMPRQAGLEYYVEGNGRIVGDGYNDSYYVDASGIRYYGVIGIGYISDDTPLYFDYGWHDDFENGTQVIFRAYMRSDGTTYTGGVWEFLFDVDPDDDGVLVLRDVYTGTYAFYENGNISDKRIYLDGHGTATIKNGDSGEILDKGSYAAVEDSDTILYHSEKQSFRFNRARIEFADEEWLICFVVEDETIYTGSDLSVLILGEMTVEDGNFVSAYLIDARGRVRKGQWGFVADTIVRARWSDRVVYYDIDKNNKTFAQNPDEFVIVGDKLVGYQGPSLIYGKLTIPAKVREIGEAAFVGVVGMYSKTEPDARGNPQVVEPAAIDFANVEIIGDYAFSEFREMYVTRIASDKITHVGKYAFYAPYTYSSVLSGGLIANYAINEVYLPAATYIGDYAFSGCNQLCIGTVKLNSVEYFGAYSFSHNAFTEGQKMELDLTGMTAEQIAAIRMDRNAFLPGPGTNADLEYGWPVRILVADQASYEATQGWFEEIAKQVRIAPAAGQGD